MSKQGILPMSVTLMLMRLKQDIKFKPSLEMPNKIFPQIIKKKKEEEEGPLAYNL